MDECQCTKETEIQQIGTDTREILSILRGDERVGRIGLCERVRGVEDQVLALQRTQASVFRGAWAVVLRLAPWIVSAIAALALWKQWVPQ